MCFLDEGKKRRNGVQTVSQTCGFAGMDACTCFCSLTFKEEGLNSSHGTKQSTLKHQRKNAGHLYPQTFSQEGKS